VEDSVNTKWVIKTLNHQSEYDIKSVPNTAYVEILIVIAGHEAGENLVVTANHKFRVNIED